MQASGRRFFVGGNWKANGTVEFVKDIAENMLNTLVFDKTLLGRCYLSHYRCSHLPSDASCASSEGSG